MISAVIVISHVYICNVLSHTAAQAGKNMNAAKLSRNFETVNRLSDIFDNIIVERPRKRRAVSDGKCKTFANNLTYPK